MKKILFLLLVVSYFFACKNEPIEKFKPLDLLKYGVPITIKAPDSVKIKTMDLMVQKDITIKAGDDYYVQIFVSDATTTDISKIKTDQLEQVKSNRYFSKIIEEEASGFIYETAIDSTNINYGFRHFRVQGDKEYVFQTGLIGTFSLEDVKTMYAAVKPEE